MKNHLGGNLGKAILLDGVLQTADRGLALPGFKPAGFAPAVKILKLAEAGKTTYLYCPGK
jgi:hypothetical protein